MRLSIPQLSAFVTVAQLGSFAEAAKALHLTSPALSSVIKSLEETTGFRTFDRTTRSVKLTQAGLAFLPHAERLLAEHRNVTRTAENIRQKKTGTVRVAASQLLSCSILPPACTAFEARWPDIQIVPVDAAFDMLQELLLRGDADLGVGPERPTDAEISAVHLFSSRLNVACSVRHPFAGRKNVSWRELKDETVILSDRRAAPLMARDARYQVTFDKTYEVGHFTTALALANENKGVVVASNYTRKLIKPFELVLVPLVEPSTMRKIMLYRNRRFALSPAAERFAEDLGRLLSSVDLVELGQ